MIKISPSILSADFSILGEEARRMEAAGVEMLHIDVMDGHFVPNITIGAPVVRSLRPKTSLKLDVHLMIDEPERYIGDFADAGSDIITIHYEATKDPSAALRLIRSKGVAPSVSIKPKTPAEAIFPLLGDVSMVLVMTVEPGFGGQALIEDTLGKVTALRRECDRRGLPLDIEVDGGVKPSNIGRVAACGANVFVAGSAIFGAKDAAAVIREMRNICG